MKSWTFVHVVTVVVAITAVFLGMSWSDLISAASVNAATSAPATAPAQEMQVEIDNFAYKPKELTIAAGTTVTWVNKDNVPHTATSSDDPRVFDSKALDTDEKYSFTFTQTGTYKYFCKVHPHMTGVVIVK